MYEFLFASKSFTEAEEREIQNLIRCISASGQYDRTVFFADGILFIIHDEEILEICDDAGNCPRGDIFPEIVTGLVDDDFMVLKAFMEDIGFDENFFSEVHAEYGYFDENDAAAYFADRGDKDSSEVLDRILSAISCSTSPYTSWKDFWHTYHRIGLDKDILYFAWDGEYVDLYENIRVTGDKRGNYDSMTFAEWVDVLTNIDHFIVTPDR